jgi:ABC-type glycerol-3-phosphate transport system permease component
MMTNSARLLSKYEGKKLKKSNILFWIVGMFFALLWIAPFVWMVSTSLKPADQVMTLNIQWIPETFTLDSYRKVFEYPVLRWGFNSLFVACVATFLGVTLGAMAGYAFARLRFPGNKGLFTLILVSLMIPTELSATPLFIAFLKIGLVDNYLALILPSVASVYSVYIFRQFFKGIPNEIEEAAIIDGASHLQIFFRIAMPMAKSATIASIVLLFTANWNLYLWPLLVTFNEEMKTLPIGISQFSSISGSHAQLTSFGPGMAAATLLSIPSLMIFLVLQRYFVEGVTSSGVKG